MWEGEEVEVFSRKERHDVRTPLTSFCLGNAGNITGDVRPLAPQIRPSLDYTWGCRTSLSKAGSLDEFIKLRSCFPVQHILSSLTPQDARLQALSTRGGAGPRRSWVYSVVRCARCCAITLFLYTERDCFSGDRHKIVPPKCRLVSTNQRAILRATGPCIHCLLSTPTEAGTA